MNLSKQKIVQVGLTALIDAWPTIKTWANLPNGVLLEIGLAVIESESRERWGDLIYLSREVDQKIDNILGYDQELYSTRSGRGYVQDDGLCAIRGDLISIMTI